MEALAPPHRRRRSHSRRWNRHTPRSHRAHAGGVACARGCHPRAMELAASRTEEQSRWWPRARATAPPRWGAGSAPPWTRARATAPPRREGGQPRYRQGLRWDVLAAVLLMDRATANVASRHRATATSDQVRPPPGARGPSKARTHAPCRRQRRIRTNRPDTPSCCAACCLLGQVRA